MSCRCVLKGTADGIGTRAPCRGRAGTSSLPAICLVTNDGQKNELPLHLEGDGRRCWPPLITKRPRGDFVVDGEMPDDGRRVARSVAAAP